MIFLSVYFDYTEMAINFDVDEEIYGEESKRVLKPIVEMLLKLGSLLKGLEIRYFRNLYLNR